MMKEKIQELLKNKKVISYLIIFAISIFLCIPLFSKYMDISRDDGIQHICRLIGNANALKQGNCFPVIMSDFCNGFGYSWNLFYSPLTAYAPLIFKLFTSSYVVTLKLFMLLTIFLSGVCLFQFTYKISKSYKASLISSILYMCAPYHLTDLYNRIAIAELASFVFLPIVFSGMFDVFHRKNTMPYGIIIGGIGLVLTHNIVAVYTAIFCFFYMLIHYKELLNLKIIYKILICMSIILLCTSFYWMPLLEHMLATQYEVFLPQRMYKDNTLISAKLSIGDLFITKHYDMNFHIGFAILLGMLFAFSYRKKFSKRAKKTLRIFFIFGLISIFMTLTIFPFEYLPNFLKMLQFPWRMLEFANFFFSIIAGFGFASFMNHNSKKEIYVVVFIMLYMCVSLIFAKKSVVIPFNEERYLQTIPITSSTGRVHAGCASFEYLPKKAFQNRKYLETRANEVIVLEGNVHIDEIKKENTNLYFKIEQVKGVSKLELPYIFYLGYHAELQKEDGTKENLKIQESDNGFCMIILSNNEKGEIQVSYKGTTLMKLSYILTLIGIGSIVWTKFYNLHNVAR